MPPIPERGEDRWPASGTESRLEAVTAGDSNPSQLLASPEREMFPESRDGPAGNPPSSGLGLQPLVVEQHKTKGPKIRAGDRD